MLQIVIRCKDCGFEVDEADIDDSDPATNLCEMAGDLDFEHECKPAGEASADSEEKEP